MFLGKKVVILVRDAEISQPARIPYSNGNSHKSHTIHRNGGISSSEPYLLLDNLLFMTVLTYFVIILLSYSRVVIFI